MQKLKELLLKIRTIDKRLFAVMGGAALLDQISKFGIIWLIGHRAEFIVVTGFFNLVLSHNYGMAFGLLDNFGYASNLIFVAVALCLIAFLTFQLSLRTGSIWQLRANPSLGIALIIGGAIGNLTDRILRGGVVDFLDFHLAEWHWPAFNLGDSAILIGVSLWLFHEILGGDSNKSEEN